MIFPPWNEEHAALRKTVRDFALNRLAPHREEWDKARAWPAREVFKEMADLGLLGIRFPEKYGGLGLDWWYTAAYVEELCQARNGGVVMSTLVQTDMATPVLAEIGTHEQCEEFLVPVISGDYVAALGITEPGCGSDVAGIRTTARKDGDDFIINGSKTFITNANIADFIVLAVRTGDDGHFGISLVLFPTKTKGFSVGRKLDKLGTHSIDSSEIHFDNCRIPQRYLLGQENAAFIHIMKNFQGERLVAALNGVAAMEISLEEAMKYGSDRKAFNRPIAKFQVWKHRFAEHLTAVRAAKLLTYHAVDACNTKDDHTLEVSMAKLHVADLAQKVMYDCLQFHGGYGYVEEYDICRASRDIRLLTIGGGTSEVMKEIIAKWSGL